MYSVEHAVAPECEFPGRCFRCSGAAWLRSESQSDLSTLSAILPGHPVSTLTLMLSNADLRCKLLAEASRAGLLREQDKILGGDFPSVDKLVLLYGLLSRPDPSMFTKGWVEWACASIWNFAVWLYAPQPRGDVFFGGRALLCDFKPEDARCFARSTLLACGCSDPLLGATHAAKEFLDAAGHPAETMIVRGTHAFQGVPPMWLGAQWEVNALPVTRRMVAFVAGDGKAGTLPVLDPLPFDWTPFVVLPASLAACSLSCGALYSL